MFESFSAVAKRAFDSNLAVDDKKSRVAGLFIILLFYRRLRESG